MQLGPAKVINFTGNTIAIPIDIEIFSPSQARIIPPQGVFLIHLYQEEVTIGRADCTINLDSTCLPLMLSRKHSVISYDNNKIYIQDTSTNGVLVNGARITASSNPNKKIELKDNDIVTFGSVQSDVVYKFHVTKKQAIASITTTPAPVPLSPSPPQTGFLLPSTNKELQNQISSDEVKVKVKPKRKAETNPVEHKPKTFFYKLTFAVGDVVEAKCQKQGSPEIHAWFEAMIVNYNSTTNQYTVQFKGYESALNETLPANCVRFLSNDDWEWSSVHVGFVSSNGWWYDAKVVKKLSKPSPNHNKPCLQVKFIDFPSLSKTCAYDDVFIPKLVPT